MRSKEIIMSKYAKLTIEMNGLTRVLEMDDIEVSMKQNVKFNKDGSKEYSLGDRYIVIHGWLSKIDHGETSEDRRIE